MILTLLKRSRSSGSIEGRTPFVGSSPIILVAARTGSGFKRFGDTPRFGMPSNASAQIIL